MVDSTGTGSPRTTAGQVLITLQPEAQSLSPDELERALAGDRVVVDGDLSAETRSRVASQLAEHSLMRRLGGTPATREPMVFEPSVGTVVDVVKRYELELAEATSDCDAMLSELREARHALLINRDHVIGTEAEIGRINRDVVRLHGELVSAKKRIRNLVKRRAGLADRVQSLQNRLTTAQRRNRALRTELDQHGAAAVPLSRRIVRRLRGGRS